jgi:pimeloyl-ACP methyl ester carboxylesterase
VVVALVLGVGCGPSDPQPRSTDAAPVGTEARDEQAQTDVAGLVDLGNGRSIHRECRGSGGPTVVLVTGLGERADNWMTTDEELAPTAGPVFAETAGFTRVCAYDRPGTGTGTGTAFESSRSTPVQQPATIADSAVDLDLLLAASGEPGPYVLVGHSLGGPIVRLYADSHPASVAGVVFVDALSEDFGDGLTPAQVAEFAALNDPVTQKRPADSERTFYAESVVPMMRATPPGPTVPTVILTADQWPFTAEMIESGRSSGAVPEFVTLELTDALWASQLVAQDRFAAMYPAAKHVTETNAGHYIHLENPELVVTSIRDVVDQVRSQPDR